MLKLNDDLAFTETCKKIPKLSLWHSRFDASGTFGRLIVEMKTVNKDMATDQ